MTTYLVEVNAGEEVLETLQKAVDHLGLDQAEDASITLIGAVDDASVSVMRRDDYSSDLVRHYRQPFELTGTGEVRDGKVHVHVTLGGEDIIVVGHLHRALVVNFFVRAHISTVG